MSSSPTATLLRPNQCCGKCKFSTPSPDNPGVLECRESPPSITVLLVPNPQGQMELPEITTFPKVRPELWCGKFKPHIETPGH